MSTPAGHSLPLSFSALLRCRCGGVILAAAALTVLAGCPPRTRSQSLEVSPKAAVAPAGAYIPVETLAYRLGMRLDSSGVYTATMTGNSNSLLLVGPPQQMALLNSQRLDEPGDIMKNDGRLMVSQGLTERLRENLRLVQGLPPPPRPTYVPPGPGLEPPVITPPPAAAVGPRVSGTVVIDPGHGGKDPGTHSRITGNEKDLVLDVARRIRTILAQRGVRVIMTREDDRFIELEDRAEKANRARADLFISIHVDSAPKNPSAMGCTVYTARDASSTSEIMARRLNAALRPAAVNSRGMQHADYKVLVLTRMPAALIELGYVTNSREAVRLAQSSYRQQLAEAIAAGIISALQAKR